MKCNKLYIHARRLVTGIAAMATGMVMLIAIIWLGLQVHKLISLEFLLIGAFILSAVYQMGAMLLYDKEIKERKECK